MSCVKDTKTCRGSVPVMATKEESSSSRVAGAWAGPHPERAASDNRQTMVLMRDMTCEQASKGDDFI